MRNEFVIGSIIIVVSMIGLAIMLHPIFWWSFIVLGPLMIIGYWDFFQTKHAIVRNFPILGRSRYVMEWFRPKVFQYFIESDTDGRPFSRIFRSIVYQRAKQVLDTAPFGTQLDVYAEGYEWMNHSIAPLDVHLVNADQRVLIGGKDCLKPYNSSIFNVSAMSFGSLSKNAVMALNGGAALGGFAHNTGEGGISPYHNKYNGDLIYQIGTGYFGCRNKDGSFSDELFKERTAAENVKMIEIKLSQGAKPGHGGILPAKKATKEIAKIRNIEPFKDVNSPPFHKAFSTPLELCYFIKNCRNLSGGKPIGFKLCVGQKSEFLAICKAMLKTGILPDFISVDGGEGGTGAAPLEFSNSVGMPFREGLAFVYNALVGFDLKTEIKLFASGKIVTGFHIFRALSLGADACSSARAMMMAVGCIQALECNKNTCPTGVATQDPELIKGLDINDKKYRVYNYHKETVESFVELMAAAGIDDPDKINRAHVHRRIIMNKTQRYNEIYPYIPESCLLHEESIPKDWEADMMVANPNSFRPSFEQVYIDED
jgi:glutamate synthase domain-containing protein 2